MDRQTHALLESAVVTPLVATGIVSSGALAEVRRMLAQAEDVPPSRLQEAERSLQQLMQRALALHASRGLTPALEKIDIRDALASACPLWPFC